MWPSTSSHWFVPRFQPLHHLFLDPDFTVVLTTQTSNKLLPFQKWPSPTVAIGWLLLTLWRLKCHLPRDFLWPPPPKFSVLLLYILSLPFSFSKDINFWKTYMYWYFAWMYVCAPCSCLIPTEIKRGYGISWNLSFGWLWAPRRCWESNLRPCKSNMCSKPRSHLSRPYVAPRSFLSQCSPPFIISCLSLSLSSFLMCLFSETVSSWGGDAFSSSPSQSSRVGSNTC